MVPCIVALAVAWPKALVLPRLSSRTPINNKYIALLIFSLSPDAARLQSFPFLKVKLKAFGAYCPVHGIRIDEFKPKDKLRMDPKTHSTFSGSR